MFALCRSVSLKKKCNGGCEVCLFVCLFSKPQNDVFCFMVDFLCRAIFTRVNKRYERPCLNVKVERGTT